jgi:uncharacterized membrane protein YdbT with pleckstrin-like domain
MGAVTRGDLNGLFDDLPSLADDSAPPRPRRRLFLPAVVFVVLVAAAVSSTVSTIHVPWLLVVVAGIFLWHRAGHHHRHSHDEHELHR